MNSTNRRFWPFDARKSVVSSLVILVGLLLVYLVLRVSTKWDPQVSDMKVILGILLFSSLPTLLSFIDVIIERVGSVEYKGLKINFSQVPQVGGGVFKVPVNIGVPGEPVTDSSTTEILVTLRQATACDVVIIDLKEGQAWWETRLLVLLAGAVRLKKPEKVIFVGTDSRIDNFFQGWGYASDLLRCLLPTHPQYLRSFYVAQAAAKQWELVEPVNPPNPATPEMSPTQHTWMTGLANQHPLMAYDVTSGLPNPLLTEQLLATDLGGKVESQGQSKWISLVRLEELFRPVLHKESIDESWSAERQISTFFEHDSDYIAVTQNGKYKTLISRLGVLNTIVKTLMEKK